MVAMCRWMMRVMYSTCGLDVLRSMTSTSRRLSLVSWPSSTAWKTPTQAAGGQAGRQAERGGEGAQPRGNRWERRQR